MPETIESRMLTVERVLAIQGQKVDDLSTQVAKLEPLTAATIRLENRTENVERTVNRLAESFDGYRDEQQERNEQAREREASDRKNTRTALLGIVGALVSALITGFITLLASGVL